MLKHLLVKEVVAPIIIILVGVLLWLISKKIINNELFYEDITDFIKGKMRG